MKHTQFSPTIYRGKKQIYTKVPNYQGICYIWDWNESKGKYEKRSSGFRYYAYKKIRGYQRTKFFESFDVARKWRESGQLFAEQSAHSDLTFQEVRLRFFQHFSKRWKVTTFETYESNAKHFAFLDPIPMVQITPQAVDAWLHHIKKSEYLSLQHHSRLTYRHELSLLRQICSYYSEYLNEAYQMPCKKRHNEDSVLDVQKYKEAKAENKFRYIPREDSEKFLAKLAQRAEAKDHLLVFYVLALFQLRTGCRIGEVCAVKWEDIDWETARISISKTVQWSRKKGRPTLVSPLTKTGEPRLIYGTEQVMTGLQKWSEVCDRKHGLIFSHNGFSPLSYRSVQHHYNSTFFALGMKWTSTHIMRHSFATDFLRATKDQYALQGQLGHKSAKQSEHYAKVTEGLVRDGMKKYEETFGCLKKVVDFQSFKTKKA